MITAQDLSKQFDDFWAVDGVNFNVPPGTVLVLLGPNGAGKTTTVRMLTSILTPTRGQASVNGFDVVKEAHHVRKSVGVLTEHHGLYGRMTAVEYLDFFGQLYNLDPVRLRDRINRLLDDYGLGDAREKRLGEYSKGMRQKLALTRALLHDPPVLLLDEPTSAMDPESARMVRNAIHQMRSSERAIVLCTHNLVEAEELADQIAIIRHGRILQSDTLEGLRRSLLGQPEFEAQLSTPANGRLPVLPAGVTLTGQSDYALRFQISTPELVNPNLLRRLLESKLQVTSFGEVPRSLEMAYLEAVGRADQSAEIRDV
jgi:ABC-2 type transport system ATP-binding protein